MCEAGHLTAPGREKRDWHDGYRNGVQLVPAHQRMPLLCDRLVGNGYCHGPLAWLEDWPEAIAAWHLGGAEAAWALIKAECFPNSSQELEPR